MALSVSGNSPNVVEAIRNANEKGALSVDCTGFDVGVIRKITDINLRVPTYHGAYGPIEDIFWILDHLIYTYLKFAHSEIATPDPVS